MNSNTSSLSRTVMRRVRTIHALRPLFSSGVLAGVLFVAAVWGIGREVWVSHVLQNMPSAENVSAVVNFFAHAFMNTRFAVQVLSVVAIAAFIWSAREIARALQQEGQLA